MKMKNKSIMLQPLKISIGSERVMITNKDKTLLMSTKSPNLYAKIKNHLDGRNSAYILGQVGVNDINIIKELIDETW